MENWVIPIGLVGCLPLYTDCKADRPLQQDERPNIVFIMSDDHTSQAWGIYGGVLSN